MSSRKNTTKTNAERSAKRIESRGRETINSARATGRELKGTAKSMADDAKMQAMDAYDSAKEKFRNAEKEIQRQIKTNPRKAMLIAVGIGAAIGAVTMNALKKKRRKDED